MSFAFAFAFNPQTLTLNNLTFEVIKQETFIKLNLKALHKVGGKLLNIFFMIPCAQESYLKIILEYIDSNFTFFVESANNSSEKHFELAMVLDVPLYEKTDETTYQEFLKELYEEELGEEDQYVGARVVKLNNEMVKNLYGEHILLKFVKKTMEPLKTPGVSSFKKCNRACSHVCEYKSIFDEVGNFSIKCTHNCDTCAYNDKNHIFYGFIIMPANECELLIFRSKNNFFYSHSELINKLRDAGFILHYQGEYLFQMSYLENLTRCGSFFNLAILINYIHLMLIPTGQKSQNIYRLSNNSTYKKYHSVPTFLWNRSNILGGVPNGPIDNNKKDGIKKFLTQDHHAITISVGGHTNHQALVVRISSNQYVLFEGKIYESVSISIHTKSEIENILMLYLELGNNSNNLSHYKLRTDAKINDEFFKEFNEEHALDIDLRIEFYKFNCEMIEFSDHQKYFAHLATNIQLLMNEIEY
jgi:hypothetical protein